MQQLYLQGIVVFFLRQFIFLSLLVLSAQSVAQYIVADEIGVEDGLPSSEVYDIVFDSVGNLWVATDAGISKYDGYGFKTIPVPQSFSDNSILKLFKDHRQTIWFSTYNGYIGYIDDDQVKFPSLNSKLKEVLEIEYVSHISFMDETEMFISTNLGKLIHVKEEEVIHLEGNQNSTSLDFKLISNKAGYYYCFEYDYEHIVDNDGYQRFSYFNDTLKLDLLDSRKSYHIKYLSLGSKKYVLSLNNVLYFIDDHKLIKTKKFAEKNRIADIFFDEQRDLLWVGFLNRGLHVYSLSDTHTPKHILFQEYTITSISKDFEGSFWLSTFENGIIRIPSLAFSILENTQGKVIRTFDFAGNQVYYSWYLNGLFSQYLAKSTKIVQHKLEDFEWYLEVVYEFHVHDDGCFFIAPSKYSKYDMDFNPLGEQYPLANLTYTFVGDSIILEGGQGYYLVHDNEYKLLFKSDSSFNERVFALEQDSKGDIWLGTLSGLYKHTDSVPVDYGQVDPVFKNRILCIERYQQGMFIGTSKIGIIYKSDAGNIVIDESIGLVSNHIKSIFVHGDVLWVGTNKGLSKINIEKIHKNQFSIHNITNFDGLPANEIYEIKQNDSLLYLATSNGIAYFDPNVILNDNPLPTTTIDMVLVAETDTLDRRSAQLLPRQGDIEFFFKGISFRNHNHLEYQYMLEGYDKEWGNTKNLSARYRNLPYGSYCFKVKATTDKVTFGKAASYSFSIKKHYTETYLFKIAVVLLIILLITLITLGAIRYNRTKEERKRQLLTAEQRALRLQMNPHFIFNSLGSIQRYILERDPYEASEYLTDFAQLMRLILESSKKGLVALEDELRSAGLYLKLENLRFNNSIKYDIKVEKNVDSTTMKIPPLMLQPLIENSIWHGIMNNGGQGEILIRIKKANSEHLHIEIFDNGIGIDKAASLMPKVEGHNSTGIANIKERLRLLNEIFNSEMRISFTDISSGNNTSTGTHVSIYVYFAEE